MTDDPFDEARLAGVTEAQIEAFLARVPSEKATV